MSYNTYRGIPKKPRRVWANEEVDVSTEDRIVVVWTLIHNRETELQQMMKEIPKFKGPFKTGISIHESLPLSVIEEGRRLAGRYKENGSEG